MNKINKGKALIILIILNSLLCILYMKDQKYISTILGIECISDFYVVNIEKGINPGSSKPYFISFIISKKKYEKYNLNYPNEVGDKSTNEAEIQSTKRSFLTNNYICTYEKMIYDLEIKSKLNNIIVVRIIIRLNLIVIGILLIILLINKIKTEREILN